jgi:hypothetical protein
MVRGADGDQSAVFGGNQGQRGTRGPAIWIAAAVIFRL